MKFVELAIGDWFYIPLEDKIYIKTNVHTGIVIYSGFHQEWIGTQSEFHFYDDIEFCSEFTVVDNTRNYLMCVKELSWYVNIQNTTTYVRMYSDILSYQKQGEIINTLDFACKTKLDVPHTKTITFRFPERQGITT